MCRAAAAVHHACASRAYHHGRSELKEKREKREREVEALATNLWDLKRTREEKGGRRRKGMINRSWRDETAQRGKTRGDMFVR